MFQVEHVQCKLSGNQTFSIHFLINFKDNNLAIKIFVVLSTAIPHLMSLIGSATLSEMT